MPIDRAEGLMRVIEEWLYTERAMSGWEGCIGEEVERCPELIFMLHLC